MNDIFQQVAAVIKIESPNPNLKTLIGQIEKLKEIHGYMDLNNGNKDTEAELKQFFLFCLCQYLDNQRIDKTDLFDELYETHKLMYLDEEFQSLPEYKRINVDDIPEISARYTK
tara:strand:- start:288 stop:629 length:342 start_codon:yes stop_codon:yes gene_type:complete